MLAVKSMEVFARYKYCSGNCHHNVNTLFWGSWNTRTASVWYSKRATGSFLKKSVIDHRSEQMFSCNSIMRGRYRYIPQWIISPSEDISSMDYFIKWRVFALVKHYMSIWSFIRIAFWYCCKPQKLWRPLWSRQKFKIDTILRHVQDSGNQEVHNPQQQDSEKVHSMFIHIFLGVSLLIPSEKSILL